MFITAFKVWDAVSGVKCYTFEGHNARVCSICPHVKEYVHVRMLYYSVFDLITGCIYFSFLLCYMILVHPHLSISFQLQSTERLRHGYMILGEQELILMALVMDTLYWLTVLMVKGCEPLAAMQLQ